MNQGGWIFMLLESSNEINSYSTENPLNSPRENDSDFRYLHLNNDNEIEEPDEDEEKPVFIWNYFNSVFFAFTVITTIGYGHMAPATIGGRTFLVLYALIGIPVNGVLITQIALLLSSKMSNLHMQSKEKYGLGLGLTFDMAFYVCPGILIFIVIPAGFFSIFEEWSFVDAVYYAFVTVSTIGFGDLVPDLGAGRYEEDKYRIGLWLYKGILMLWITIGLGYIVMILDFITKGLRHKWFHGIFGEDVQHLIRPSFDDGSQVLLKSSGDLDYMRRIVNELYIMKIKPVHHYDDEDCYSEYEKVSEYKSSRRVSWDGESQLRKHQTNLSLFTSRRNSLSDSALNSIDKAKTFEEALGEFVDPSALLARVATALNQNLINDIEVAMSEMNQADQEINNQSKEPQKNGSDKPPTEPKIRRYSKHQKNETLTEVVVVNPLQPTMIKENIGEKPYEEKKTEEVRTRKMSKLQSAASSRRTSRIENGGYQRKISSVGPSRKISLETTSIADFLRAMNAVHEKIKPEVQDEKNTDEKNKENYSNSALENKTKSVKKKEEIKNNPQQNNDESKEGNPSNEKKTGRRHGVSYHNFSYVNENLEEKNEESKNENEI